jgi:hypothetical protein
MEEEQFDWNVCVKPVEASIFLTPPKQQCRYNGGFVRVPYTEEWRVKGPKTEDIRDGKSPGEEEGIVVLVVVGSRTVLRTESSVEGRREEEVVSSI